MNRKQSETWCALMAGRLALEEFGWCRGKSIDSEGRVCAIGALRVATDAESGWCSDLPGFAELDEAVAHSYGVAEWNDYVAKSKRDVLAAFDRALAAVERGDQ